MRVIRNPDIRFGHTIYVHQKVDSTQNRAFELARNGANQGSVVLATIQDKGRGRFEKVWVSDKGGLYFSIIYRPQKTLSEVTSLTKTIGMCVKKALEKNISKFMPMKFEIKGINDIMLNNHKISGIIVETETVASANNQLNYYIIGIGVNINQKHFPRHYESIATSLRMETDRYFSRYRILQTICDSLGNTLPN
jgi:BirA family biotin operon repressor/biotin-[acetyl-CoA-carboxylase] ligase